jgi:hypothetical protein
MPCQSAKLGMTQEIVAGPGGTERPVASGHGGPAVSEAPGKKGRWEYAGERRLRIWRGTLNAKKGRSPEETALSISTSPRCGD